MGLAGWAESEVPKPPVPGACMKRFFSNLFIFLFALLFVLGVVNQSQAAKETKRVLILYSQEVMLEKTGT
jgi:hypothetical protein